MSSREEQRTKDSKLEMMDPSPGEVVFSIPHLRDSIFQYHYKILLKEDFKLPDKLPYKILLKEDPGKLPSDWLPVTGYSV